MQIDAGSNHSSPGSEVGQKRKREGSEEKSIKKKLIDTDSEKEDDGGKLLYLLIEKYKVNIDLFF